MTNYKIENVAFFRGIEVQNGQVNIEDGENACVDHEDIILWPCGDWCYRYELEEMTHKSDDYQIIKYGTEEHERITLV